MTTRPETVQIGDAVYVVAPLDPAADCDGEFCAKSGAIRLRSGVAAAYTKYLLTHEIVHGLLEHAGALAGDGDEKFTEEQVACIMGRALPALLRDNPQLVSYLVRA